MKGMRPKIFKSIQLKILAGFFVITFITVITMGMYSYNTTSDAINKKLNNAMLSNLELIGKSVDGEVSRIEKNFEFLSLSKELQSLLNKSEDADTDGALWSIQNDAEKFFTSAFYREKGIVSVFFWGNSGKAVTYTNAYTPNIRDWEKYPWFREREKMDGKTHVLGIIENPDSLSETKYVYAAGKVMRDTQDTRDFHKIGTIYILFNPANFSDLYSSEDPAQVGAITITNEIGEVISQDGSDALPSDISREDFIKPVLGGRQGHFISNIDGERVVIAYYTCPQSGYKIIQRIPYSFLYKELSDIKRLTVFLSILCMTILYVISFFISRGIATPIKHLQVAMGKVEKGDFDTEVAIKSDDEIGRMTVSFNFMVRRIKELFQKAIDEEILKKELEIKSLQYQINPHFLYNILASIRLTAMMEGSKKATNMLQSLRRLMSRTIGKTGMFISIATEMENIQDFIYIQEICYNGKLNVRYDLQEKIMKYKVPNLLLQPLVENAIFHGVDKKIDSSQIEISGFESEDKVIFQIKDNGAGMTEENIRKVLSEPESNRKDSLNHIGIKNVDDRLKLNFGPQYGIKIESIEGAGTTVTVQVPVIAERSESAGDECIVG